MRAVIASSICAVIVAALGAVPDARADVYRYIDAQGVVHYSDRWAPGYELIRRSTSRPGAGRPAESEPQSDSARLQASEQRIREQLEQSQTTAAVRDDVARKRAEQCKQATERYEQAIAARRIYKNRENGEREYLSDAEADQVRIALRRERDGACGSASG